MMGDRVEKEEKCLISAVITSDPLTGTIKRLQDDYRELVGEAIPFRKLGYNSVEHCLRSMPNIVQIIGLRPSVQLKPISKKSAHVNELVMKQREYPPSDGLTKNAMMIRSRIQPANNDQLNSQSRCYNGMNSHHNGFNQHYNGIINYTMAEKIENEVKSMISDVITSSSHMCTIEQLQKDYKRLVGNDIPFRKLGYNSLEHYLRSMPDVIQVVGQGPFAHLKPISEKSAHINKLEIKPSSSGLTKNAMMIRKRIQPANNDQLNSQSRCYNGMNSHHNGFNQHYNGIINYTMVEKIENKVKSMISDVITSSSHMCTIEQLQEDYKRLVGNDIPFRKLGYNSLEHCLRSMSDVVQVVGQGPFAQLKPISEKSAHVNKLVIKPSSSALTKNAMMIRRRIQPANNVQLNLQSGYYIDTNSHQNYTKPHPWMNNSVNTYDRTYDHSRTNNNHNYGARRNNENVNGDNNHSNYTYNTNHDNNIRTNNYNNDVSRDENVNGVLVRNVSSLAENSYNLEMCSKKKGKKCLPQEPHVEISENDDQNVKNSQKFVKNLPHDVLFNKEVIKCFHDGRIHQGNRIEFKICQISNMTEFFIHLRESIPALNKLMYDMKDFYNKYNEKYAIPHDLVVERLICVCKYSSSYYRATILNVHDTEKDVKVFLSDYGKVCFVPEEELCLLTEPFAQLPFQAIECNLGGVDPILNDDNLRRKLSRVFHDWVEQRDTHAVIGNVDKENEVIDLYVIDKETNQSVNEVIRMLKYA